MACLAAACMSWKYAVKRSLCADNSAPFKQSCSDGTSAWSLTSQTKCYNRQYENITISIVQSWPKTQNSQSNNSCIFHQTFVDHRTPTSWLCLEKSLYGVGHKKRGTLVCLNHCQLLTYFQNSFTGTLCRQFAIMWLSYIPPHGKCVSTLPCEI